MVSVTSPEIVRRLNIISPVLVVVAVDVVVVEDEEDGEVALAVQLDAFNLASASDNLSLLCMYIYCPCIYMYGL